jgi:hypothetical protein
MTFLCGKISTRGNTNLTEKRKKGTISVRLVSYVRHHIFLCILGRYFENCLKNTKNAAKGRVIARRQEGNNFAVKAFGDAKGIKCCIYKVKKCQ